MKRKRITQIFPFLLPLREWQKKKCFYLKMKFDGNIYATEIRKEKMPYEVFSASSLMINKDSGFDIKYQVNKVHNLKVASKPINNIVIKPGETFSFWKLVKDADKYERYKDGLNLVDGKIVGSYGGGLCQLSNMLFWLFLHTPLSVVERHSHSTEYFPPSHKDELSGVDATIAEGWLDLKVRNDTNASFQISIFFDDECIFGKIYSDFKPEFKYDIFNKGLSYYKKNARIYQSTFICCNKTNIKTLENEEVVLYKNVCEIGYALSNNIRIKEGLI